MTSPTCALQRRLRVVVAFIAQGPAQKGTAVGKCAGSTASEAAAARSAAAAASLAPTADSHQTDRELEGEGCGATYRAMWWYVHHVCA